jgi:hypothetical protein
MADAESVMVTITGKNGYKVQITVHGHERTHLEFTQEADAEPIPRDLGSNELWAPAWRRFTFAVMQRISYRAEDFVDVARARHVV